MKLVAIDHDPWTKLGPTITHDLELGSDGQELARCCVSNFYCEFFHIFFLVVLWQIYRAEKHQTSSMVSEVAVAELNTHIFFL